MPTEIANEQLRPGHWYVGEGRLAMWTGKLFVGPGYSMGEWLLDEMQYGERGFSPYWEFDAQRYQAEGNKETPHGK
jgi:hypothetical protein